MSGSSTAVTQQPSQGGTNPFVPLSWVAGIGAAIWLGTGGWSELFPPRPRQPVGVEFRRTYHPPEPAPVWVSAHYRADGAFVPGHFRTAADDTPLNNWSAYPNVNPYTGEQGRRNGFNR